MAQLTCQKLCVGYDGRPVLQGLDFEAFAGDYLCIVGENGSGKSTLMKTILGLQTPISGSILTGDGLRKNEIGYLPQQTQVQKDFPASVREIVLSGCQGRCGSRSFYNKEEKQLAADAMEKMQITPLAKRCYRTLSGGQQQRVLLARALCATRKMLFLDEPVSGLDPKVTAEMYGAALTHCPLLLRRCLPQTTPVTAACSPTAATSPPLPVPGMRWHWQGLPWSWARPRMPSFWT